MREALDTDWMTASQNDSLSQAIAREGGRLRNFIRKRVSSDQDAEDILQDVFYELVEAYRMMQPVEQVGAWMFRVARNRIIDLFRKNKANAAVHRVDDEGEEGLDLEGWLPSPDGGPQAAYARGVLLEELELALAELPREQREVFLAHEIEGQSFKQIAERTGIGVNTLLSRKRYAVLHLRERLRSIYDQFVNPQGEQP
jgi:RNA polymerase sigma factor (sigma-70 family)